jgi:ubiquinone biosynthesis protein UbiJ
LKALARTLPWFVEQAFAQALGPIVGQRLADAGRRLLALPEYAATRIGESVSSYARDEAGLLAHGADMRRLALDVAELAARTDALAARLDALAARVTGYAA